MIQSPSLPLFRRLWRLLAMSAVLTLLWSVLADNQGWGFGAAVIAAAILAGLKLSVSPTSWFLSPFGLLRFTGYFLKESLLAGIDVARRAFDPALPVRPALITRPLRLPAGPPRTLYVTAMTLLPGTLAADLDGDEVVIHILNPGADAELERLEQRVADVFLLSPAGRENHG